MMVALLSCIARLGASGIRRRAKVQRPKLCSVCAPPPAFGTCEHPKPMSRGLSRIASSALRQSIITHTGVHVINVQDGYGHTFDERDESEHHGSNRFCLPGPLLLVRRREAKDEEEHEAYHRSDEAMHDHESPELQIRSYPENRLQDVPSEAVPGEELSGERHFLIHLDMITVPH